MEFQYENYLKGTKAKYKVTDGNHYELYENGKRGNDIVLTIDIDFQRYLEDTLSSNGAVKRAIIFSEDHVVTNIVESSCEDDGKGILCSPLNGSEPFYYTDKERAGMSIYGFHPDFLELIKNNLNEFVKSANLEKDEYLLPDVIADYIKKGHQVTLLDTTAHWLGMTYREDLDNIKNEIKKYIEKGVYPNNLWED